MKYWLGVVIGSVATFCLSVGGINLYMRHQLIRNHGRGLGIALWKQFRM